MLNKRKPAARKGHVVLVNASKVVKKGQPKNYIPQDGVVRIASAFNEGQAVDGHVAVVAIDKLREADYNLGPSRWVTEGNATEQHDIADLVTTLKRLSAQSSDLDRSLLALLRPLTEHSSES